MLPQIIDIVQHNVGIKNELQGCHKISHCH